MFGIESLNSLPDNAMFGRLEDGSWKIHQFTLAKHISCTIPPKPYTRTAFVAVCTVRLATNSKTASVNGSSIRPCFPPTERAGTFLSNSDKRPVQLHDRLPRASQAAWRRSRLSNVVDDQRRAVEHKHTMSYIHVLTLWACDQWRPFKTLHT